MIEIARALALLRAEAVPICEAGGLAFVSCRDDGTGRIRCRFRKPGDNANDYWSISIRCDRVDLASEERIRRLARSRAGMLVEWAAGRAP